MNDNRAMIKNDVNNSGNAGSGKPEAGSVSDKHPNLTLLESGQNPGAILRSAREKAGLSLSDISSQTKINERQLELIESGDVSRLPPETFAKAFIKSYCKALKMDPTPVIVAYGFTEGSTAAKVASAANAESARVDAFETKMPTSSRRLNTLSFDHKPGKSIGYGIVLAALVLMAVFYIPVFLGDSETELVSEPVEMVDPAPAASVPAPAPVAPDAATAVDSSTATPLESQTAGQGLPSSVFPAIQAMNQGASPANAPVAQLPGTQPNVAGAQPPAVAAPSTANPAGALPQAASPASGSAVTVPAPAPSSAAAVAAPATQTKPVAATEGALRFNFNEQSWVTVRDANDQVLVSQLNNAGSSIDIKGKAPFKLIVGNAKAVRVFSNGKLVDLNSSIRGEVARLTVQ